MERERRHSKALGDLSALEYDPETHIFKNSDRRLGWELHHYQDLVGQERPGAPEVRGPFEKMCESLTQWRFLNRRLLQCEFNAFAPLRGRVFYLSFRILGFPVNLGLRVHRVFNEEVINVDGHPERIWGYACRSLDGYPDVGEVSFHLSKDLQTGHLFFAVKTASKEERILSFWFRWAFWIFAPGVRRLLSLNALRRMRRLAHRHESTKLVWTVLSLSAQ